MVRRVANSPPVGQSVEEEAADSSEEHEHVGTEVSLAGGRGAGGTYAHARLD